MSTYDLRALKQTDEDFLWEMLYHALYLPAGQPPFPKEVVNEPEIARYVEGWGKDHDRGFIAFDRSTSEPIGAVWIRLFKRESPGYGYLDDETPELSIALLPGYRHRGIGTDLLTRLIDEARGRYVALSLSVSADNPAAHLYQRLGFEVVERNGPSLTMKKVLD
jgi:ribosomal protein S18 acetylase RimI-like enzyme